ncbi:39S ribosomal protein L47, mitochondrial [Rhinatrema bivittatum]|uniref:39S ribosomal protein L47, mitochondrial n=1 Tax=Rhinatrema bivittatum TaxID=194408 RepID=UPI0011266BA0|nr:39S ribosomal protein L47, mitochondrial [Rhinatrema bivittatum]
MAVAWVARSRGLCSKVTALLRPLVVTCSDGRAGPLGPAFCDFYKTAANVASPHQFRFFHTSVPWKGLEEFFDDPKNWGESTVKSGAAWTENQLRAKNSEDLHKLWYVLLKEKNMLLTLEQESKRQRLAMPSPERLRKVDRSLNRLDTVIQEREDALRLLQTGQEKERPGDWRRNCFGQTTWYKFHEWPIPWYLNKRYKMRKFYALPYVNHHIRLRIENHLRKKARKKKLEIENKLALQKRFPNLAVRSQA